LGGERLRRVGLVPFGLISNDSGSQRVILGKGLSCLSSRLLDFFISKARPFQIHFFNGDTLKMSPRIEFHLISYNPVRAVNAELTAIL
jgi:hypothetical protein